jgi:hypothetical protein
MTDKPQASKNKSAPLLNPKIIWAISVSHNSATTSRRVPETLRTYKFSFWFRLIHVAVLFVLMLSATM